MFLENYPVHIVNATKKSGLAQKAALYLKKYGFNIPEKESIWSTKEKYKKTEIHYLYNPQDATGSVAKNSKTLEVLGNFFLSAEQKPLSALKYATAEGAKIEVVLGDDANLFIK